MTIWLTSDPHLGHNRDFIWKARGYSSSEEHDAAFVDAWNGIVRPEDEVYILGDLVVGEADRGYESLRKLNPCKVHIVRGNHDNENKIAAYREIFGGNLGTLSYVEVLKWNKQYIYLSHYPTITNNADDCTKTFKLLTLGFHGHTHSREPFYNDNPICYNVGLDAHCKLIDIDYAVDSCRKKYNEKRNL